MATPASIREQLIEKLDELTQEELEDLLDYLNMLSDPDELTPEEIVAYDRALADMEKGDYVTLEELEQELRAE